MIVDITYLDRSGTSYEVVTQMFTNVFEVDRNDDTFFTVVHDDDGITFEEFFRKEDILSIEVNHERDVIGPVKEILEERERQARVQASGLSLA